MSEPRKWSDLWSRVQGKASRMHHHVQLLRSIRHIHGPSRLATGPRDVTIVALVRDGHYYLDGFFAHYRSIGARHFVFFDNGSSDGTIARIAREPGTIIVQSSLSWDLFEYDFRRYAAETYCPNRWCLFADMDEQFDFEGSQEIGLAGLVQYLDAHGYTALVGQMLEMFPDTPLRETATLPYDEATRRYRYYDPGHIKAYDYYDPAISISYYLQTNTTADAPIQFLFGGIRRKMFGENCALTKHSLVFIGKGTRPGVHAHCASHVACADFTALIRHYKFTNNPFGRDAKSVQNATFSHGEDRQRLDTIQNDPDLTLYSDDARAFTGIADLQSNGFLIPSARFSAFIAANTDD